MNDSLIQYNHLQKKKTLEKKTNTPRQHFTLFPNNLLKVKDLVYPNSLQLEHFLKVFVAKKG